MADGKITGRVIRHHLHLHRGKDTGTLFVTFVKTRKQYRPANGEQQQAASDFLTFEYFMDGSPAAHKRVELLQKLADESTLVEIDYNLKSRNYTDKNNEKIFKEYKQLCDFDILEAKQAVEDRLGHKSESEDPPAAFDPEKAGAFIEQNVEKHLVTNKQASTTEGKYGNPFNQ